MVSFPGFQFAGQTSPYNEYSIIIVIDLQYVFMCKRGIEARRIQSNFFVIYTIWDTFFDKNSNGKQVM